MQIGSVQVLMAQVLGPSCTHAAGNELHQILGVTKNSKAKTTRSLRELISKNLLQHTTHASLGVSPGLPALSSPSKLLVWARALHYVRAHVLHRAMNSYGLQVAPVHSHASFDSLDGGLLMMFSDLLGAIRMACARAEAAGLEMSLSAGRGGRGRSGAGGGGSSSRAAPGRGRGRPAGRAVVNGGQGAAAGSAQDLAPVTSGEAASCTEAHGICHFLHSLKSSPVRVGGLLVAHSILTSHCPCIILTAPCCAWCKGVVLLSLHRIIRTAHSMRLDASCVLACLGGGLEQQQQPSQGQSSQQPLQPVWQASPQPPSGRASDTGAVIAASVAAAAALCSGNRLHEFGTVLSGGTVRCCSSGRAAAA